MTAEQDAADVLEYLYLNQQTPVDAAELFDVSRLSRDAVRDALDRLEDQMLVDIGVKPDEGGYEDVSITEKGCDTVETVGAFQDEFGVALDLNEIAQEWHRD